MCGPRFFTVFVWLLVSPLALAQQFSIVVIKPAGAIAPGASRLKILSSGDLIGHSIDVVDLIELAYDVPSNPSPRLISLPEWVRQRFDITAKTSESLSLGAMDIRTQRQTIAILMQKLLSDHFSLALSVTTIATPVYALRHLGNGQKLAKSTTSPKNCIFDTASDGCHTFAIGFGHPLNARAVDMSDLAHYLENWTDLPVVDKTATTGLFKMHSQGWRPMKLPPPPPGTSGTGAEFANLSTLSAVLSSFGLQLRREEETLRFYAVERVDEPNAK